MTVNSLNISKDFNEMFDKINNYLSIDYKFSNEIVDAKEKYFEITGKVNDDDLDFSNRMNAFLLWFTFNWKVSPGNVSPFDEYIEYLKKKEEKSEQNLMENQKNHIHSLFTFIKIKNNKTLIKDVFTSDKYNIKDIDYFNKVSKNTIFETRIFTFNNSFYFSNYFITHPNIAKKDIFKEAKNIKKNGLNKIDFLLKLHSFHTKWNRYRNINIKSIYHFDASIPAAK